jgi:two-component system, LytTR family, sensor kinase
MTWRWLQIRRRDALVLLGLFALFGLLQGNAVWLAINADGRDASWSHPHFWELTGSLSAYACVWIPFTAALNAPRPRPWSRFLAIHAAGFVLYAALHTAIMIGSRVVLYPLLGWGSYVYGGTSFRLPMEWNKDLVGYAIMAVGFGLVGAWRDNQRRALRDAKLATELRDAQLRALVGQLNPHFLFNALNTISAVMYVDLARTDRLLADLGQMLRASLRDDAAPTWSLTEERAHTEHFLAVMLARFGDRLTVRWDVDERTGDTHVPRFTLQLLVENAIKHNQDGRGTLEISIAARRTADRIEVEVADNGRGFASTSPAGTGLTTLRQALELCHGPHTSLVLDRAPAGGACVRVTVPA